MRHAAFMDHTGVAGLTNKLDVINKADFTNKAVLGIISTEAKLRGFAAENLKTVSERALEMVDASQRAMSKLYESTAERVSTALISHPVTRLREIQTFSEQILSQVAPLRDHLYADVLAAQRISDLSILRRLEEDEEEWEGS
jgi:hypothetical protein